ncbi:MAG: DUF1186 domain-containing protein [Caldilineaceae bacterium]
MTNNTYISPVSTLLTLGDIRRGADWPNYLAYGLAEEHIPALIRMALDEDLHWADSNSAEVWAPIHAWRALGQLHADAAIEPLVQLLHKVDEWDDDWVGEEIPKVLAMIGPSALPAIHTFLASPEHGLWARVAASATLEEMGKQHPASRAECVAVLTDQLRAYPQQDPTLNAELIVALVELHAVEVAPVMEAAFAAKAVDLSIQGDWEEVQIELGLLAERLTPKPPMGWFPAAWGDRLPELTALRKMLDA